MWHMQHNSYACTNTIYMLCMVAFQPPSSILTASCVLPASLHHPHSLLPASVQPQSSIVSDTQVHWPSIYFCTYVQWQSIMVAIYICVQSPFIFFDNIYALVINLYVWYVTQIHVQCFFWLLGQKHHVGALWHQGCLPIVHWYDRLVCVELHMQN